MKCVSLPLALLAIGLMSTGCSKHSSTAVVQDSNPEITLHDSSGATSLTISETAGSIDIRITFSQVLITPITIGFTTSGDATEESDYVLQSKTVRIEPSDTVLNGSVYEATFTFINLINDSEVEVNETLNLSLSSASYGRLAIPSTLTINITSEDVATKPINN